MNNYDKSMELLHELSKQWHPASPTFQAINDGISALKTLADMEQNSIPHNVSRETFVDYLDKMYFYNCNGVKCQDCQFYTKPNRENLTCLSAQIGSLLSDYRNVLTYMEILYRKEHENEHV